MSTHSPGPSDDIQLTIGNDGMTTWADLPCGCRWWHDTDLRTDDGEPEHSINFCAAHDASKLMASATERGAIRAYAIVSPGLPRRTVDVGFGATTPAAVEFLSQIFPGGTWRNDEDGSPVYVVPGLFTREVLLEERDDYEPTNYFDAQGRVIEQL